MAATRRNLLEAGIGAVALSVNHAARAHGQETGIETIVIGVDGSSPTGAKIDEYRRSGADVWQFSDNIIDLEYMDNLQTFVDDHSSRIVLAKS